MRQVIQRASNAGPKSAKEKILQAYGLHNIQHFLWDFRFSDPYAASSYDTLHSDDLGKWGHHLWVLLLEVMEELKVKGSLAQKYVLMTRSACHEPYFHTEAVWKNFLVGMG